MCSLPSNGGITYEYDTISTAVIRLLISGLSVNQNEDDLEVGLIKGAFERSNIRCVPAALEESNICVVNLIMQGP